MGIGAGIFLLVIGLILVLDAINFPASVTDVVDPEIVGWVCLVVGVLALVLSLVANQQRSRSTHVEERRDL